MHRFAVAYSKAQLPSLKLRLFNPVTLFALLLIPIRLAQANPLPSLPPPNPLLTSEELECSRNETLHSDQPARPQPSAVIIQNLSVHRFDTLQDALDCNPATVANMSLAEFLTLVDEASYNCISSFYSYSDYSDQIFSDARLQGLVSEVVARSSSLTTTNSQNLHNFLDVIYVAYYLDFYHSSDITFDRTALKPAVITALNAILASPAILATGDHWPETRNAMVRLIDGAQLGGLFQPFLSTILQRAYQQPELMSSYYELLTAYAVFYLYQRVEQQDSFANLLIPEMMNLLRQHATTTNFVRTNYESLTSNAIWSIANILYYKSQLGLSTSQETFVVETLQSAYHGFPSTSELYLRAITSVTSRLNQDCFTFPDTTQVCKSVVASALKPQVFTNHHVVDDGRLIINTPLTFSSIEKLYFAAKEVEAQFHRIVGSAEVVTGDEDRPLNIYVYGSRKDYETYQSFLFNLSTSNGGIYIESDSTFYTYERTSADSIYSLEELFRHEYVHYLAGKYIIPGQFGDSPTYNNDRLTWFDEGLAEFLAGSHRSKGIQRRRSIVSQLATDSVKLTPGQVVTSSYSSDFTFYRYSDALFDYLYNNQFSRLKNLITALRSADLTAFDTEVQEIGTDASIATEYSAHLDAMIADLSNAIVPVTLPPDAEGLETFDPNIISYFFRQQQLFKEATCSLDAVELLGRYKCTGELSTPDNDIRLAWIKFDRSLNTALIDLDLSQLNNLSHTVCYLTDPEANAGRISSNYTCTGPLAQVYPALTDDLDGDGTPNSQDEDDDGDGTADLDEINVGRNPNVFDPPPTPTPTVTPTPVPTNQQLREALSELLSQIKRPLPNKNLRSSALRQSLTKIKEILVTSNPFGKRWGKVKQYYLRMKFLTGALSRKSKWTRADMRSVRLAIAEFRQQIK